MPLKFRCACGQALIVSRKFAGHPVRCPKCDTKIRVPQEASEAESPITGRQEPGPAKQPHRPQESDAARYGSDKDRNSEQSGDRNARSAPAGAAGRPFQARGKMPPPSVVTPAPGNSAVDRMRAIVAPAAPRKPPEAFAAQLQSKSDPVSTEEISESEASGAAISGYEPPRRLVTTVRMLALSLLVLALFGAAPAVYEAIEHLRVPGLRGVATWAFVILLLSFMQIGYAAYLWQLPDWSSVWVVTIITLTLAVAYAMLLGATYVSRQDGWIVQLLQLSDKLDGGQAAGWCFIMMSLLSLLSYLSGRISVRWSQNP